jgi:predicted nuclease of predicted toxin-antitoxin system
MADLYANENFPLAAVRSLREMGHDVLTSFEAGTANQQVPDAQVLAFATYSSRAVLTHNRLHFKKLHRQRKDHAGIVICTEDVDFTALASRIHSSIAQNEPLRGKLISVTRSPSDSRTT